MSSSSSSVVSHESLESNTPCHSAQSSPFPSRPNSPNPHAEQLVTFLNDLNLVNQEEAVEVAVEEEEPVINVEEEVEPVVNDEEEPVGEEGVFEDIPGKQTSLSEIPDFITCPSYVESTALNSSQLTHSYSTVLKYLPSQDKTFATHVYIGGKGGKFHILPQDLAKLYTCHHHVIIKHNAVTSFLVERVNPHLGVVKFFMDIDFECASFHMVLDTFKLKDTPHLFYERLVAAVRFVLNMNDDDEVVLSFRLPYKIHLNCPTWYMSIDEAKGACDMVRDFLHDSYMKFKPSPAQMVNWNTVIDGSVYKNGLRLLGAKKDVKNPDDDVKQINDAFFQGKSVMEILHTQVYHVYDFEARKPIPLKDLTLAQFLKTIVGATCQEEWDYMKSLGFGASTVVFGNGMSSSKGKQVVRAVTGNASRSNVALEVTDCNVRSVSDLEEQLVLANDIRTCEFISLKKTGILESMKLQGTVKHFPIHVDRDASGFYYQILENHFRLPANTDTMADEIKSYLRDVCRIEGTPFYGYFKEDELEIESVRPFQYDMYMYLAIATNVIVCPFVNRPHARSANTNGKNNPVHLRLYSDGKLQMRCFNEGCHESVFPLKDVYFPINQLECPRLLKAFRLNNLKDKAFTIFNSFYSDRSNINDSSIAHIAYYCMEFLQCDGVKQSLDFYQFNSEQHRWVREDGRENYIISSVVPRILRFFINSKITEHIFIKENVVDAYESWSKDIASYTKFLDKFKDKVINKKLCCSSYTENLKRQVASMMNSDFSRLLRNCKFNTMGLYKTFGELLDANPDLLVFKNGVLELDTMLFRPGHRDDYCSLSLNYEYRPWEDYLASKDENDVKYTGQIEQYFADLFHDVEIREYVINVLARSILGKADERFYFFYGNGANGKSFLLNLLTKTFGDYGVQLPVTIFTKARSDPTAANPELFRLKAKRLAMFQEPDNDDTINVGLLKLLSGGDQLSTRKLYKDTVTFYPQATYFLATNNLPTIKGSDGGTWRRIRAICFESKFVDDGDTLFRNHPHRVIKKPNMEKDSEAWPAYLMSFLCYRFKDIRDKNLSFDEPLSVIEFGKRQRADNDLFSRFVATGDIANTDSDKGFDLHELYALYVGFLNSNQVSGRKMNKLEFEKQINLVFGDGRETVIPDPNDPTKMEYGKVYPIYVNVDKLNSVIKK